MVEGRKCVKRAGTKLKQLYHNRTECDRCRNTHNTIAELNLNGFEKRIFNMNVYLVFFVAGMTWMIHRSEKEQANRQTTSALKVCLSINDLHQGKLTSRFQPIYFNLHYNNSFNPLISKQFFAHICRRRKVLYHKKVNKIQLIPFFHIKGWSID